MEDFSQFQPLMNELVVGCYSTLAERYDEQLERCSYRSPEVVATVLLGLQRGGERYLDLGAGTGLVGAAARRLGVTGELVAADLSPQMLERIDRTTYNEVVCVDACASLPFEAESFDAVVFAGLMEYIGTPADLFGEVQRVLKPRGHAVFTFVPTLEGSVRSFDVGHLALAHHPDAVANALEQQGLRPLLRKEYPAYSNRGEWVHHQVVLAGRDRAE